MQRASAWLAMVQAAAIMILGLGVSACTGGEGEAVDGGISGSGGHGTGGGKVGSGGNDGAGGDVGSGGSAGAGGKMGGGGTAGNPGSGGRAGSGGNVGSGGKTGSGGSVGSGGQGAGGAAGQIENPEARCTGATSGAMKKNNILPDPFMMHDGTRISTKAEWECRRAEIKKDLEKYEIGTKQPPPTVAATYSGSSLTVTVSTGSGSIQLTSGVSGSGTCVVIGMGMDLNLVTGCKKITFAHDQVVKYGSTDTQNQSDPYYKLYPDQFGKIGNYAAWSWGVSRLIDGLDKVKSQIGIDMTRIAVHGCSYAGKMALFSGALDSRVALTIAQESGGGGINAWRTSQDFTTRTGTNIEKINNTSGSWFMKSMKALDPYSLPHDHHELIALVAPRAIIALGNPEYEWLGDESGYKSVNVAMAVFKALGVEDHLGYDFTGNHSHCSAASSQVTSVNAFVNKFLKGSTTANTRITIKPVSSKFDLSYTVDWTTPTLQ